MKHLVILTILLFAYISFSQSYSTGDTLRGGYGIGRDWWDVTHYDLSVDFNMEEHQLKGCNIITFSVLKTNQHPILQLDLQSPMILDSVICYADKQRIGSLNVSLNYKLKSAFLLPFEFPAFTKTGAILKTYVYFHGSPREAINPPWSGGVIWRKDPKGKDWCTVACQVTGPSCWFPCKNSQADEADSVDTRYTCPSSIKCVSNGKLISSKNLKNGRTSYHWKVSNPINTYCIVPTFGDLVPLKRNLEGEKGTLETSFWVISGNEKNGLKKYEDVSKTLKAFEYWFGPYPFYEDGLKIIESPYLGMEHQGAIAYGNQYENGYLGLDLSGTDIGLKWDYVIVHEAGHEWFGNSITCKDIADMWIHEAFATYSEVLFTEYWYGRPSADTYCKGMRMNIHNKIPIIGEYGLNDEGSDDKYNKGANILHTIRLLLDNDTVFRGMLRGINKEFYHKIVTTQEIENYMINFTKLDLQPIFDQYLRAKNIPTLERATVNGKEKCRWIYCNDNFKMDVITNKGRFLCTTEWREIPFETEELTLNDNLYYFVKQQKK